MYTSNSRQSKRFSSKVAGQVYHGEGKASRSVHRCHDRGTWAVHTPLIVCQVCVHSECNISWPTRGVHVPPSVCFGLYCHHARMLPSEVRPYPLAKGVASAAGPFHDSTLVRVNNVPAVDN